MTQLSIKEMSFIEDEIQAEEITAKTMSWCASQCKDPVLKETFEQMAESHNIKIFELTKYLNQTNILQ